MIGVVFIDFVFDDVVDVDFFFEKFVFYFGFVVFLEQLIDLQILPFEGF
jgi:hypothetical protein